jgi:23S rRNA (guanosine2251-2'-O)-methyltransferase
MVTVVYGYHPVHEVLRHRPQMVRRVIVGQGRRGSRRIRIEELCRRHLIPVQAASERQLNELTGGVHNGFAAELQSETDILEPAAGDPRLVVLLEDVQDPRNLGAILRVCEGGGVGRVLIRDRGSAPISPAVLKTAAGGAEWLNIERVVNSATAIEMLKKQGFWIYGTDAAGRPPWEIDLTGKVAICLGGEAKGLRARTRKICDDLIGLPMRGRVESLNVSAAAAAIIYEAVRQRLAAGGLPAAGDSG